MLPWFAGLPLTCSNRPMCGRPASMRHSEIVRSGYRDRRLPALFTEAAPLQPWLDVQAALAGRRPTWASSPEFREGPEGFAHTAVEEKRIRILGPVPGISAGRTRQRPDREHERGFQGLSRHRAHLRINFD